MKTSSRLETLNSLLAVALKLITKKKAAPAKAAEAEAR